MTNLGEIENLTFVRSYQVPNAAAGAVETVCIYRTPMGYQVTLPVAAFRTSPALKEVPPKKISVLIRIED